MKEKILALFILFLIGFASAGLYYDVALSYEDGEVEVVDVGVVYSRFDKSNYDFEDSSDRYSLVLLDDLNNEIYSESVSVPNIRIVDYLDSEGDGIGGGEIVFLENVSFDLYLPYSEDVNLIDIRKMGGDVVESVDVRTYAKVRGVFERDGEKGYIISDKTKVEGDGESQNNLFYLILGLVVFAVVAFGVAFFLGKKKR